MKLRTHYLLIVLLIFVAACSPTQVEDSAVSLPTETDASTAAPINTETSAPTSTPLPTNTPEPTETPLPSPTPAPTQIGGGNASIVFSSYSTGTGDIYVLNLLDDSLTLISGHERPENRPMWSPDGHKILFMSMENVPERNVVLVNADGTGKRFITDSQAGNYEDDHFFTWSPDGEFFFICAAPFNWTREDYEYQQVTRYDADGANPEPVDFFPVMWSPDGTKVVGYSGMSGNREIFVANADFTDVQNLTNDAAKDEQPVWSPDGSQILFVSKRSSSTDVFVMNSDGSDLRNLTDFPSNVQMADWSPDGETVYFTAGPGGNWDIYSMPAAGGEMTNITQSGTDIFTFSFTPDYENLYFQAYNGRATSLHTVKVDGTDYRAIVNGTQNHLSGVSPDGRWVIFQSDLSGTVSNYRLSLDDLTTMLPISEAYFEMQMQDSQWQP